MKQLSLSLRWFNERSQQLVHPRPWQSAQLEIEGLPAGYPWQKLRLYTGIGAHLPTSLYLKRKTHKGLVLHADWAAAEPGFHHLRLHETTNSQAFSLWESSFFIGAAPLTQALWLHMIETTYQNTHLRFQARTPVPLQGIHTQDLNHTSPFSYAIGEAIGEFSRLQWLVSPAAKLGESLSHLKSQHSHHVLPLYRTQKIAPQLLYRNLKALPLHTPVPQNKPGIPEIASTLQFLMLALHHRYRWLSYALPQMSKDTKSLSHALHQLAQNWRKLWTQWQSHPYHQSQPRWAPDSLKQLKSACAQLPQLKPWLACAELLQSPLTPGVLTPPPLFTGYIGFGYVYQYWCTQHLGKALAKHLLSIGWKAQGPERHWQSPTGEQLVLCVERQYAPARKSPTIETLYSISRGQQPDLSLLYFESRRHWLQQSPQKGLVFEVKFRQDNQGRPRKVDLDRLHAYRDSVYVRSSSPSNRRLFVGGALLYPGYLERYEPGLEALTCLPEQELRLDYLLNHLLNP